MTAFIGRARLRVGGLMALGALWAILGAPSNAWAQKSPLAQRAYARAEAHLAAGEMGPAIAELQSVVRYEPKFPLGWYLLASSLRRAGDCDRAVAAYRQYNAFRPQEAEPHYGIGLCLATVGDRAGALASFRRYIDLEKKPEAHGFVEDAQRRAAELERALADAAKATPPGEPAVLEEARRLRAAGRGAEAIATLRKWLAEHAKDDDTATAARAQADLGAALIVDKELAGAVRALQVAVRLAPAHPTPWYNLAFALRQSGRETEAIDAYSRYITFEPTDPDPCYGLGFALASVGRTDEALATFRRYVALETRPAERPWVEKVRAEIARLSGKPSDEDRRRATAGPGAKALVPGAASVPSTGASGAAPVASRAPAVVPAPAAPHATGSANRAASPGPHGAVALPLPAASAPPAPPSAAATAPPTSPPPNARETAPPRQP